MMQHIEVKRSYRYYSNDCEHPERVLFVLHGYGQHPEFFIRKFKADENTLIIAPEGLHRYYLQGYSGRVGCSWMTSDDRQQDINDYVNYLDALAEKIKAEFPDTELHCLGFSQGAATASRWLALGNSSLKSLTLWCGVFPPDLPEISLDKFNKISCNLVYAKQDEFANEEEIKKQIAKFDNSGIKFDVRALPGKHDVKPQDFYVYWTDLINQMN